MFSTVFILSIALMSVIRPSESQRRGGPRVITEPQDFEVEAGSSVTLPCSIRNVGRRSVFWFKGNDPQGRELIMQMKSVRGQFTVPRQYQEIIATGKLATSNSDLIINDLQLSDDDTYTCSVAYARQSVTHTLSVTGGVPELYLTAVPSDGYVSVGEGIPQTLSCVASGNLPTTVTWTKEGEPSVIAVGNVYNIPATVRDDSGRYTCTADNGVSAPVSMTFDVQVEYVDVEAVETTVVASGDDMTVLLACRMHGYPEPQVTWYTSVGPVVEDSTHRSYSRGNEHFLMITEMTQADLGEYQCYGYSDKSRDHDVITVTAAPSAVNILEVAPRGGSRYYVSWEVNSLSPIDYYHVALRELDTENVQTSSVGGSSTPYDGRTLYRGNSEFDLTPGQTYELMVKAVAQGHQPGPDQEEPYVIRVPRGGTGLRVTDDYYSRQSQPRTESSYGSDTSYDSNSSYGSDSYYGTESSYRSESSYRTDRPEVRYPQETGDHSRDKWQWWKTTLTAISRLSQLARSLQ